MRREARQAGSGEEGFLLIGAIVLIFLIFLVLGLAAPTMARELRREREIEAVHRGDQYVRAIQMYYLKFHHYPGTMEQLEKSNNIRFLRQEYVDPMTGKSDWRMIPVGQQKTTVKGFFGQPLAGVPTGGLGAAAGMVSSFGASSTGSGLGNSSSSGTSGASSSGLTFGGASSAAGTGSIGSGSVAGTTSTGGSGSSSSSSGISSQSATSFSGSGAPFVGVGSSASGNSMIVLNEQTTYPTWEFIYDPRTEQMKAKVNLLGGGMATGNGPGLSGATALGTPSSSSSTPTATSPTATTPSSSAPQ